MSFFEPVLRIEPSGDLKTYTLEATVLVPSGCYVANGVASGFPPNIGGTPETEPVQLLIVRRKGPCTGAVEALTFVKQRIPLTAGKTTLVAYVMLDDEADGSLQPAVAGVGSIAIPRSEDMTRLGLEPFAAAKSGAWIGSGEISGWINRMLPGGSPTVHVRVGMWAPTSGYKYHLKAIGPFGFTGLTLLCEMKATRPTGFVLQVWTHTIVPHDGPLGPQQNYTSVAVAFEGTLQIGPIRTVS
jgi:hypothetical protein